MKMRLLNSSPGKRVVCSGRQYAPSSFTRMSLTSTFDIRLWSTSLSALRTSLSSFESMVTAAMAGMVSNMYSCQALSRFSAVFGTSVLRFEAMMARWRGSVT